MNAILLLLLTTLLPGSNVAGPVTVSSTTESYDHYAIVAPALVINGSDSDTGDRTTVCALGMSHDTLSVAHDDRSGKYNIKQGLL